MNIIYKRMVHEEKNDLRSLYIYENEHYFIRIFTDIEVYDDVIESLDVNVKCDMPETVIEDYRATIEDSYDTILITGRTLSFMKGYPMETLLNNMKGGLI